MTVAIQTTGIIKCVYFIIQIIWIYKRNSKFKARQTHYTKSARNRLEISEWYRKSFKHTQGNSKFKAWKAWHKFWVVKIKNVTVLCDSMVERLPHLSSNLRLASLMGSSPVRDKLLLHVLYTYYSVLNRFTIVYVCFIIAFLQSNLNNVSIN